MEYHKDQEIYQKLIPVICAANYLDICGLLDIAGKCISDTLHGKKTKEMRVVLGVEDDFTEEQKKQNVKDAAWCTLTPEEEQKIRKREEEEK